jgi:hypothetical protein
VPEKGGGATQSRHGAAAFVALQRNSSAAGAHSSQGGFAAARRSLEFAPSHPATSSKEPTMISRLTFSAAVFAAIATVSLSYAADAAQQPQVVETPRAAAAAPAAIVVMPKVEVTGRRIR